MKSTVLAVLLLNCLCATGAVVAGESPIRVGTFDVDASPPVGSPLAYDPTKGVELPLSCRGVVISGGGQPIVLCAVDWIGVANDGQKVFREALARAAGTAPEWVAVHALHQHDAPRCDFSAEELLAKHGLNDAVFDDRFLRDVVRRAALAVGDAATNATPVTHLGLGKATVEKVASNRRILGPDGKVQHVRWTATKDPEVRAAPVGTIDPEVRIISFWNGEQPIAALTYYATHPQSYYRTGLANPDFPGMARNQRQEATGVFHVHFNGAGGNIGAGKWNDGAPENRQILADRLADGMARAWDATRKTPLAAADVAWKTLAVALPAAPHLDEEQLVRTLADQSANVAARSSAANDLLWLRRTKAGDTIDISCLTLGPARVLHMPGELFVEYQLAAQRYRPGLFVAMAAYGDYAPGYIGTEIAYEQGGYESSPRASLVAPAVESVLVTAMQQLLEVPASDQSSKIVRPSEIRE
ncbi:MAG TPA: hypothetical protein VML55_03735 [Planctomycetaceae bacterium]|nr:hypothetical protein [Planctomycetaceae bacterium]